MLLAYIGNTWYYWLIPTNGIFNINLNDTFFKILGRFTEPIYENVPLPWNSKEVRSRASSVQSAPEIKSPPGKLPQQVVQPVKEDMEKKIEVVPVKNNVLDISSNSNVSQVTTITSIVHSAEQSFGKYNIIKVFNYSLNMYTNRSYY